MGLTAFNRARRIAEEQAEQEKQEAANAYIKEMNGGKEYDGSDLADGFQLAGEGTQEGEGAQGDTEASPEGEKAADEAASSPTGPKRRGRKPAAEVAAEADAQER